MDTLCFGITMCNSRFAIPIEQRFMLYHIHYAEVHRYRWDNPAWELNVYFIREGDALKAFWGWERNGTPLE